MCGEAFQQLGPSGEYECSPCASVSQPAAPRLGSELDGGNRLPSPDHAGTADCFAIPDGSTIKHDGASCLALQHRFLTAGPCPECKYTSSDREVTSGLVDGLGTWLTRPVSYA